MRPLEKAHRDGEIWVWVPNEPRLLTQMREWCETSLGNHAIGLHSWEITGFGRHENIFKFRKMETLLLFKLAWASEILDELHFGS
jgi:hypothetical protein